jgi:hypothetical protein
MRWLQQASKTMKVGFKRLSLAIFPSLFALRSVTTVGGTENFYPEVAVSKSGLAGFTSGGGFCECLHHEFRGYESSPFFVKMSKFT